MDIDQDPQTPSKNGPWLLPEAFDHGLLHVNTLNTSTEGGSPQKLSGMGVMGKNVEDLKRSILLLGKGVRRLQEFERSLSKNHAAIDDFVITMKKCKPVWVNIARQEFDWTEEKAIATIEVFDILYKIRLGDLKDESIFDKNRVYMATFSVFLALQLYTNFPHGGIISISASANDTWPLDSRESPAVKIKDKFISQEEQKQICLKSIDTGIYKDSHQAHMPLCSPIGSPNGKDYSVRELSMKSLSMESVFRFEFFMSNLECFLWILCGAPEGKMESTTSYPALEDDYLLDKCLVGALSFLVGTGFENNEYNLVDKIESSLWNDEGFISCAKLLDWLNRNVSENKALHPKFIDQVNKDVKMDKPVTSIPFVVKSLFRGTIIKSACYDACTYFNEKEKTVKQLDSFVGSSPGVRSRLVIANCRQCTIYILHPCRFVRLVGCTDCTIVLGPVSGILTVDHCDQVKVIAPVNCVTLSNTVDSELSIYTNTRPILTGDCRRIKIGPYCTFYPRLKLHMSSSKLNKFTKDKVSLWKDPLVLDCDEVDQSSEKNGDKYDESTVKDSEPYKCYTLCQPKDFEPFIVPFGDDKVPKSLVCDRIPFPLDLNYINVLKRKKEGAKTLLSAVDQAVIEGGKYGNANNIDTDRCTADSRREEFQKTVQSAFQDWLVSTGKVKQVIDLVKLKPMLH